MFEIFYPEVGILRIHPVTEISFLRLPAFKHDRTFQTGKFFRGQVFIGIENSTRQKPTKRKRPMSRCLILLPLTNSIAIRKLHLILFSLITRQVEEEGANPYRADICFPK